MNARDIFPYITITFGIFVFLLGVPRVRMAVIAPLQEREILPVKKLKAKNSELISDAGENLSLMFAGVIIILIGIILLNADR